MTDKDRIRLAEAMGWKPGRTDTVSVMGRSYSHTRCIDPDGSDRAFPPDPFTDANDDYAVLEWIRHHEKYQSPFWNVVRWSYWWDYHIGDYARAALKVLDSERQTFNNRTGTP